MDHLHVTIKAYSKAYAYTHIQKPQYTIEGVTQGSFSPIFNKKISRRKQRGH